MSKYDKKYDRASKNLINDHEKEIINFLLNSNLEKIEVVKFI